MSQTASVKMLLLLLLLLLRATLPHQTLKP